MSEEEPVSLYELIAKDIKNLLRSVSNDGTRFNLDDPNFADTPNRVAKAYIETTEGYEMDPAQILSKTFPSEGYDQMIVVKDIDFYSTCAHHLFPFYGKVAIGYLPSATTKSVVGLSKFSRLVRCFSRRFQLQERMTGEIANAIQKHLEPRGVGVIVYESKHLCSHARGVEDAHSTMNTSYLLGEFRDDPSVRSEFFRLALGK